MQNSDCLFCKIANKTINADIILESETYIAFNDINRQAPIHVLLIPKAHYKNLGAIDDAKLYKELMQGIKEVVTKLNIEDGYRLVVNTGKLGGQAVDHLHFHILAGRQLDWPPG